jgi:hypothetical protein
VSRRWDIWLLSVLIVGATGAIYLGSFRAATQVMGVGNPGSWGPVEGAPPPEPWFLTAMLSLRAPYAFPASILTILDSAWLLPVIAAYAAVVSVGGDFGWGSLRSILIASPSRSLYLLRRLIAIALVVGLSLVLVLVLAPVVQLVLIGAVGERFPSASTPISTLLGVLAVRLLAALTFGSIAAALTLIARSVFGGVALLAVFVALDAGVSALPSSGALGVLRDLSLSGAVSTILDRLRPPPPALIVDYTVGGLVPSAHQPVPVAHVLSVEVGAAALVAWLVVAIGIGCWRLRTMDIVE